MKTIFLKSTLLFLILLSSTLSQGQKLENSIFWEISGNGLTKSSYIYGTVKFIPSKDFTFGIDAKNKLKECKIFLTETLLDHHSLRELNKAAHLPHHQSIEDLISKEEYNALKKIFLERLNVSKLKFDLVYSQFKPIVLSTTMTRLSLGKNVNYYEIELADIANKNGLLVQGLESASREISAMESFDSDNQITALVHTIQHFDRQLLDYKEMIASYKLGNLHKTLEYTLHPSENDEDFKKNFFYKRNVEWIDQIEKYIKKESSFFAIGAAHLADKEGVINLLREKGYTVKPVK